MKHSTLLARTLKQEYSLDFFPAQLHDTNLKENITTNLKENTSNLKENTL